MSNNKINVTELDFDQIKSNLKNYLQGQDKFTDYNFEGSALSTLLDVLAYNTHYQALYYNLAINEAFIDSASKRSSVVSKAGELGYTPRSITSSRAIVNVVMTNAQLNAPEFIELPRLTPFTAVNEFTSEHTFYTTESRLAQRDGTTYTFNDVVIQEGYPLTYRQVINTVGTSDIIIPNINVDVNTIRVMVQTNAETSEFETYTRAESILNITEESTIYFLKELPSKQVMVQFGNGRLGLPLQPGNVVTIQYVVSHGSVANGVRLFKYAGPSFPNTSINTVTVTPSYNGADAESIEDIRFNAPRLYSTQNRCVTADDYRSVIKAMVPAVKDVNVWGGEENNPPSYGEVFISMINQSGGVFSEAEKSDILREVVTPRKPVTVRVKVIDPIFIDIGLRVNFYYDPLVTTKSNGDLTAIVHSAIQTYASQNLLSYAGVLRQSHLTRFIDDSDISILNSNVSVRLRVALQPVYNRSVDYQISLYNEILATATPTESVLSTGIITNLAPQICYIDDAPTSSTRGVLRLFYIENNIKVIVKDNIGSVDYRTGTIKVTGLTIMSTAVTNSLIFAIKPTTGDIGVTQNHVMRIDSGNLTITAIPQTSGSYQPISGRS